MTTSCTQLAFDLVADAPVRSLDELLVEMKARMEKNHPRYYQPFSADEANILRGHHAAQVAPLDPAAPLFTLAHGIRIATGFTRVVIGDYGAYIEIAPEQIIAGTLKPKFNGTPPRPVKYIWLTVIGDPSVKVYEQKGTVAYADYQVGLFYVAPSDVQPYQMPRTVYEFVTACVVYHGHDGGGSESVPSWLITELPHARLAYLNAGGDPNLACELDAVPYLMTASLEGPLSSEWVHIYVRIAFKTLREHGAGFANLPSDEDDLTREANRPLSQYEEQLLTKLRGDIRASQIRHAKKGAAR